MNYGGASPVKTGGVDKGELAELRRKRDESTNSLLMTDDLSSNLFGVASILQEIRDVLEEELPEIRSQLVELNLHHQFS